MIVGRIIYAGSKLALSNQWKNTALWELSGVEGKVDVDQHCYLPMDRLLERQSAIQRTLAARHLQDGHLVLYDITSSYFEGAYLQSDIERCLSHGLKAAKRSAKISFCQDFKTAKAGGNRSEMFIEEPG